MLLVATILLAASTSNASTETLSAKDLRKDAASIEQIVNDSYAYLERLQNGRFVIPAKLRLESERVASKHDLIRFSERALSLLADHHAITGSSTAESWALFPSFADLWVEARADRYVIEQVREGSPAEKAGIRAGDRLVAADGVAMQAAVQAFWTDLGTIGGARRDAYAARVLAAGRRDRPRLLSVQTGKEPPRTLTLANLYQKRADQPPLSVTAHGSELSIRFNDSLGSSDTIAAFDAAMARLRPGQRVVLDLTDTPGGGNTTVARAVLGWFVTKPTFYQVHNLPSEERRTGIPRQWAEQVLPRPAKSYSGPVAVVRVGRWTGSMGEGLAIGFAALGARVVGSRMAGLLGATYDYDLPASGLKLKIPAERLYSVTGIPREQFVTQGARGQQ